MKINIILYLYINNATSEAFFKKELKDVTPQVLSIFSNLEKGIPYHEQWGDALLVCNCVSKKIINKNDEVLTLYISLEQKNTIMNLNMVKEEIKSFNWINL